MGKYSVPKSIRQQKPKGTMVKIIFRHYHVYEYSNCTDSNGLRRTKLWRKVIGVIKEGPCFVPNSTFASDSEIRSLDCGKYAVSIANTGKTCSIPWKIFNSEDAVHIYGLTLSHFIQGFTYLKAAKDYYDMSGLPIACTSLKMNCTLYLPCMTRLGEGREAYCKWRKSSSPYEFRLDRHHRPFERLQFHGKRPCRERI